MIFSTTLLTVAVSPEKATLSDGLFPSGFLLPRRPPPLPLSGSDSLSLQWPHWDLRGWWRREKLDVFVDAGPILLTDPCSAPLGDPNHRFPGDTFLRTLPPPPTTPTPLAPSWASVQMGGEVMPASTRGSFWVKLSSACTRGDVGAQGVKRGRESPGDGGGTDSSIQQDSKGPSRRTPLSRRVALQHVLRSCQDLTSSLLNAGKMQVAGAALLQGIGRGSSAGRP